MSDLLKALEELNERLELSLAGLKVIEEHVSDLEAKTAEISRLVDDLNE